MEVSRKETLNPLNGKSGGPQSWAGRFGEEENILPLMGYKISVHFFVNSLSQQP
jgi:hypothetical protein